MFGRIGSYLRANHLALLALFCALGGGAYAAATIGPGDIKKNAVRAKHVKKNAIRGAEVKNGTLRARELAGVALLESSGRIGMSVSQDTQRTEDVLASAGRELSVDAECSQSLAEISALFVFDDPVPPSGTVITTGGDDGVVADGINPVEIGESNTTGAGFRNADAFSAITPSGDVLQGVLHSAVNVQSEDCVFAIQALG